MTLASIIPISVKHICKLVNHKEAFKLLSILLKNKHSSKFSYDDIYSPVLALCASKKALSQGQQLHAHMITSNVLRNSVFLNTKLVYMYGKCGALHYAQNLFDRMFHRTVFTWNAMIGACVLNSEPLLALDFFYDMRVCGVYLDACTFLCVLKACGVIRDVCFGSAIHGLVIKCGYESIGFIGNTMVAMYAKFEDLDKARRVFDSMEDKQDVVSWNSIISVYAASGQSVEALRLFREMQKVALPLDTYTYVAALQACENSYYEDQGSEIHAAIVKSSYCLDIHVANALISMYIKCGNLGEAVRVFNEFDKRDCISWNTLLSGYVQHDLCIEALTLFSDMQNAGQKPDKVSVMSILTACGRLGKLFNGMEVHAYVIKTGLNVDLLVGNALLDFYSKCSCTNHMWRAFNNMPNKDNVTWTTIIAGCAQNNSHVKALEIFHKSQTKMISVDPMMMGSTLKACSGLKCLNYVKEIHGCALRRGLSDLMLQNEIINAYGECGSVEYATQMFNSIESKDIVAWTSIICCYVNNGLANEALELFQTMNRGNIETDSVALVSILSAIASLSILNKGKEVHGFIIRKGFVLEGTLPNSLVDMYTRCGTLDNAYKVFHCVRNRDLVLWTSMINANGMHGRGKVAIDLFFEMENLGILPDHITFLALLYACSHSGLTTEGKSFLEIMKSKYQLEPWPEHYVCLVDLLGRANRLEEAYQFVLEMENEPTAEIWCALLRSCQVYSNKELEQVAAEKLLEFDIVNPGNYVLVSNVFAASGKWKDVERVRTAMRRSGMKKKPGRSRIEEGNKIHTFS